MAEFFRVGHERMWPEWFHDAVSANDVVTRSGGWKQPISKAFVLIRGQYMEVNHGDYVVLNNDGTLGIQLHRTND